MANSPTKKPAEAKAEKATGMLSANINPVARNAIWKEHCLKENSKLRLSTDFHINPNTIAYISEKPNRFKPSVKVTQEEVAEAKELISGLSMSSNNDLAPSQKYAVPQTSSQEYGWCSHPLIEPDLLFTYPHRPTAITQFADKYQECMHKSPYARRDPLDQHLSKKDMQKTPDYVHAAVNTSRLGTPSVASSNQVSGMDTNRLQNPTSGGPVQPSGNVKADDGDTSKDDGKTAV